MALFRGQYMYLWGLLADRRPMLLAVEATGRVRA
jgi:hypothetical protein